MRTSRGASSKTRHTSSLCLTFFTNVLPSAAKPFTASTARSVLSGGWVNAKSEWVGTDGQSKYFWRVASLDVVALALAGVASDDGKVGASDGEDGAAVFCVRVELSLLRDCDCGHVWHEEGKEEGERRRWVMSKDADDILASLS
jgi:hypothetical protein